MSNEKANTRKRNKASWLQRTVNKGLKPISPAPIFNTNIKVTNPKQAKRLMSKLISEFIKGNVLDSEAKTLAYLVTVYIGIIKEVETEERIRKIENRLSNE